MRQKKNNRRNDCICMNEIEIEERTNEMIVLA